MAFKYNEKMSKNLKLNKYNIGIIEIDDTGLRTTLGEILYVTMCNIIYRYI